ncbi:MAG TPA: hypothetical protein DDW91_01590, partial [Shewanella frigidimarina]|nr:hypothetical protein [Shewanella frigidimarina]
MVATIIPKNEILEDRDYYEVDSFIDDLILKNCKSSEMMNLMALEASSLSTSVASRSRELDEQGLIIRLFKTFTGSNHHVSARNQRDLAQSQYLGQKMLVKLAESNLMTYQMAVSIGDKLNMVALDANDTRLQVAKLNQSLAKFFSNIRQKL